MRYPKAVLVALPLLLAGCPTKNDPLFCNGTDRQCDPKSATPFCDLAKSECVSQLPPDIGVSMDMATDAGMTDMAGVDEGLDMPASSDGGGADANVDLKPICATFADCTNAALPICGAGGVCRTCTSSADDSQCNSHAPSSLCLTEGTNMGHCGACRPATSAQSAQCTTATTPICGTDGTCRACKAHSECTSGICKSNGACANAATEIAYVDSRGNMTTCQALPGGMRDGSSLANAFCDIQNAVDGTKPYILVTGRGTGATAAYGHVAITRDVVIVGPGGQAPTTAAITAFGNQGVLITDGKVTLDGLEITAATSSKNGVSCSQTGSPAVTVLRSFIHNNDGVGIKTSDCDPVIITGNTLTSNNGGGISTSGGTTVTISSNTVNSNGGGGISTSGGTTVTISSNTVNSNGGGGISTSGGTTVTISSNTVNSNGGGGISTSGGTVTISENTIYKNTGGSGIDIGSSTSYSILNNLIGFNNAGGVSIANTVTSVQGFQFNTVADNGAGSSAGGIACGSGDRVIEGSIVINNSHTSGGSGTQFFGNCRLINVVTGTDGIASDGQLTGTPTFIDETLTNVNLHLDVTPGAKRDSNNGCCIDKIKMTIDGGTMMLPLTDVDGETRPKGLGWDIGADEAL